MNRTSNIIIALLVAATLLCGGLDYYLFSRVNALKKAAGSQADLADLKKRIADAEKHRLELEAELAALRQAPGSPDGSDQGPPGGPGQGRGNFMQNFATLMQNPDAQKLEPRAISS